MLCEPGKEYLVEARLLPLARAAGQPDVDSYVALLGRDPSERAKAIDALTINETSWFRDLAPYQAFTEAMLPPLLEARAHVKHLEIWSAACSSGQEAYSLTMLLKENLPPGWTARIHATDVSPSMLAALRADTRLVRASAWALPFILFTWKVIVWDKILGLGVTDGLGDNERILGQTIAGFYFLTAGAMQITRVIRR